jgi:hypothetical protein
VCYACSSFIFSVIPFSSFLSCSVYSFSWFKFFGFGYEVFGIIVYENFAIAATASIVYVMLHVACVVFCDICSTRELTIISKLVKL